MIRADGTSSITTEVDPIATTAKCSESGVRVCLGDEHATIIVDGIGFTFPASKLASVKDVIGYAMSPTRSPTHAPV
jgi:hypothetical protein